jgi:hypothetical protein
MAKRTQHHYVTRAYLEGFSLPNGEPLYVYVRNRTPYFRGQPDKIARIHNYYTLQRGDGIFDNRLEEVLQAAVEDPGVDVIRRLNAGHYDIAEDDRGQLALFIAIQEYLVPWMRENMEQALKAMQEKAMAAMIDAPGFLERRIAELTEAKQNEHNLRAADLREGVRKGKIGLAPNPGASLWAMGHLCDLLTDYYFVMRWLILETTSLPFITSDCPVHRFYRPVDPGRPFMGISDARVQVRFPLSPHKMLVMSNDIQKANRYAELREKGFHDEAEKLRATPSTILHRTITESEVGEINAHTICMAAKMVFSPVQMPQIPPIFSGECQNLRQEVITHPNGIVQFSMIYPQRK